MNGIADVFIDHILQDLRLAPSLEDWLRTAKKPIRISAAAVNEDILIEQASAKIGLTDPSPIIDVLEFLKLGQGYCQSRPEFGLPILMNSFGPPLVRSVFGPAYEVENTVFDPAWVAEGIIVSHFGRIPSLDEVLSPFDGLIHDCERAFHV